MNLDVLVGRPRALRVTLPGSDGTLVVPVEPGSGTGPFGTSQRDVPDAPSTLNVKPFVAVDSP